MRSKGFITHGVKEESSEKDGQVSLGLVFIEQKHHKLAECDAVVQELTSGSAGQQTLDPSSILPRAAALLPPSQSSTQETYS